MEVSDWPLEKILPYPGNPRKRSKKAVEKVAASIREFGPRQPIVVDEAGVILVGHTRRDAAASLLMPTFPVHQALGLTEAQKKAYRIADNRTNEETEWDDDLLKIEFEALKGFDLDLSLTGFDSIPSPRPLTVSLSDRFGIPPFSVLDARQGYWQERKRAWLALGIQSELGRGGAPGGSPRPASQLTVNGTTQRGDGVGRPLA